MKIKQLTTLKHKLQWLVLLTALLGVSQGVWGQDKIGIYNRNGGGKWEEFNFSNKKVTVEFSSTSTVYVHVIQGSESYALSNQTMTRTSHTGWWLYLNNGDCGVTIDVPGSYTFERSDVKTVSGTKHCELTVTYPWVIRGNFSGSWKNYNFSGGTTVTVSDAVSSNTAREFKVFTDNVYSQDGSTMTRSNCTDWVIYTNKNNSKITIDLSGTYTFTWSNDNNHKLSVTYPTPKIKGSWDGWNVHDMTVSSATSITWTKTFSTTGKYEFVIVPTTGTGDYKNKNFTRSSNSQTLQQNTGSNATVVIDHPGSYTFTWNSTNGNLTITYPTPSTPSALYIKGPLVNNGTWTSDYRQNWSTMTYNKTSNVFTFTFNASNACDNCSNQALNFCVSTETDDDGKIHWAMNSTRTGWAFSGGTDGDNFVASSSIVDGTSVPVVLTITYNTTTYKFDMTLERPCSNPTISSNLSSSTTWQKCGNDTGRELSITATGGSGTLTYQWYRNTTNTLTDEVADLTGATAVTDMVEGGNTYSPSASDYGVFYYCCVVRSGGACSANKATSVYTGQITIKQTPVVTPSSVEVKQYEPVKLNATNSSVNWSITSYTGAAAADEYYLYDETKSSAMFKGAEGEYEITATSTGTGSCAATSEITVVEDDDEGCQ